MASEIKHGINHKVSSQCGYTATTRQSAGRFAMSPVGTKSSHWRAPSQEVPCLDRTFRLFVVLGPTTRTTPLRWAARNGRPLPIPGLSVFVPGISSKQCIASRGRTKRSRLILAAKKPIGRRSSQLLSEERRSRAARRPDMGQSQSRRGQHVSIYIARVSSNGIVDPIQRRHLRSILPAASLS
jgi:hypothetical protein